MPICCIVPNPAGGVGGPCGPGGGLYGPELPCAWSGTMFWLACWVTEGDVGVMGVLGMWSIRNRNGPDPLDAAQLYCCPPC
eukprot:scaffold5630_cov31-Attheya_sp.AAC.1